MWEATAMELRAGKGRGWWTWRVLAAAVVGAVGFAVYWVTAGKYTDSYTNDLGTVLVSADGRTLTANPDLTTVGSGSCLGNTTTDLVVAESGQAVTVRAHVRVDASVRCVPGSAAGYYGLSAALAAPLWGRSLLDGSGKPIAYFDSRTLLRTQPPGSTYRLQHDLPGIWISYLPRQVSAAAVACTQEYDIGASGTPLWIVQIDGADPRPNPPGAVTPVTVRSVRGKAFALDSTLNAVEWVERGQTMQLVSGSSTAELIALAGTLR
jgi:hypothetical protein